MACRGEWDLRPPSPETVGKGNPSETISEKMSDMVGRTIGIGGGGAFLCRRVSSFDFGFL